MTLREWSLDFLEKNWKLLMLCVLFILLIAAHAFMLHYNRPASVVSWAEGMIGSVFTAIILKLKD